VIERRRAQRSFGDGLIAGEVKDLREVWMNHADRIKSVRGREDGLELLQHGLMLMWDDAVERARPGKPKTLDLAVVEEAGGLDALLSNHADKVMASVASDGRRERVVEAMFRALTDVNAEGSAIRRPVAFQELCAIVGAAPKELERVIDAFRAPGVSFLTPYSPLPIAEKTPIDISHGALIRCWRALGPSESGWLKSEFRDGLAWRTLLFQAEYFVSEKWGYLSEPATELRVDWLRERSEAWSRRYGGGWSKVRALIDASREHWAVQAKLQQDRRQAEIDDELQRSEAEVIAKQHAEPVRGETTTPQQNLAKRYYVSYAWSDPSDPCRTETVDRFCDEARRVGINILRDKTALRPGDLISGFMQEMGDGDRVYIFMSDKYLKSPYCMFELFELWRNSQQKQDVFLQRARVFCIEDVKIYQPRDRLSYAEYWIEERKQLRQIIERVSIDSAGEDAIVRYRLMKKFSDEVSDVLAMFADRVQARTFEEFVEYGFEDPPSTAAVVRADR
jgi:hypothetical protein